jgi:hypothetical protein
LNRTVPNISVPRLPSVLPDLAAFGLGLVCAHLLGWNTTALVWSLWLSSFVVGYLTIVSVIGGGIFIGSVLVANPQFPARLRLGALAVGALVALFLLGFFSLHVCGFHSVHASFLIRFFPLDGVPKNAFNLTFMNPVALWRTALAHLVPRYGIFLLPIIIAERRALFGWVEAALHNRKQLGSGGGLADLVQQSAGSMKGGLTRPYVNVMRMHVLIFFFAICHGLRIDSMPVYIVTYAAYFFPWSAFKSTAPPQPVPPLRADRLPSR